MRLLESHCPLVSGDIEVHQVATFRREYRYWTQARDEWPEETQWIVEHVAGGAKEPSLILVSRNGEVKSIKGLSFHRKEIIDFLELNQIRFDRERLLFALFVLSTLATFALILVRRMRSERFNQELSQ